MKNKNIDNLRLKQLEIENKTIKQDLEEIKLKVASLNNFQQKLNLDKYRTRVY
jgi:hypothetical protein